MSIDSDRKYEEDRFGEKSKKFYQDIKWLFWKASLDIHSFSEQCEKHIRNKKFNNIIDGGTGTGALIYKLLENLNINVDNIIGVDIEPVLVNAGNLFFQRDLLVKRNKMFKNVHLEVGDVYNLDPILKKYKLEYGSVDLFTALALVEHIDASKAIREIYRILKPGAYAYFPNNLGDDELPNRKEIYSERQKHGSDIQIYDPAHEDEFNKLLNTPLPAFSILYPWHPLDEKILSNFEDLLISKQNYYGVIQGNKYAGGRLPGYLVSEGDFKFDLIAHCRTDWNIIKPNADEEKNTLEYLIKVFASANDHPYLLGDIEGVNDEEIKKWKERRVDLEELKKWIELRLCQIKKGLLGFQCIQSSTLARKPENEIKLSQGNNIANVRNGLRTQLEGIQAIF